MTQGQINRYHVILKSIEGQMSVAEVATATGLSERQVIRLRKGVKEEGAAFLIHKGKDKPSMRATPDKTKEKIVNLYRSDDYNGSNFLHFSELLSEREDITLSYTTVRDTLKAAGIDSPRKRRRFKQHRSRKRKEQEGLLLQMDATPHEWFGGKRKYALHGGMDDAKGEITGAYMTKHECLHGYLETMRQTITNHGIPISAYTDRHCIFRSTIADKLTLEDQLAGKLINDTQFGRAMRELGITMIYARSAQAKGRIERLWGTLQDRLVIEFRINNIKTVHEANSFLVDYIPKFNNRFAVEAESAESAYTQLSPELDLDHILCVKEIRSLDNGGVFSFNSKSWLIADNLVPGKSKVEVIASATKGLIALYKGKPYEVMPYIKPKKVSKPKVSEKQEAKCWFLNRKIPIYAPEMTDTETYEMLNDIFLSKYA